MWKLISNFVHSLADIGPRPRPRAGPSRLADDILEAADQISTALIGLGYQADFSLGSLTEIERLFDDHLEYGQAVAGGFFSESLGFRLFALGSYCGEVLRRSVGGEWITDDSDPQGEINVMLELSNGSRCWPVQRAISRFQSTENNIAHWGALLQKS